jgi:hypothetical protein
MPRISFSYGKVAKLSLKIRFEGMLSEAQLKMKTRLAPQLWLPDQVVIHLMSTCYDVTMMIQLLVEVGTDRVLFR